MKLAVLEPNNPLLRKTCLPVGKNDLRKNALQEEINALLDYVYGNSNKGSKRNALQPMTVGLSANQVGLTHQISIVDLAIGKKGYNDLHVLINPEIIWQSSAVTQNYEGCVNLPSIWGSVKRATKIKVQAMDRSGNEIQLTLSGWPARLLQHEIGHLQGELFIDLLANPQKAFLVEKEDYAQFKKEKDAWKKYIDVSHLAKNT
jgi:peptide deformylase